MPKKLKNPWRPFGGEKYRAYDYANNKRQANTIARKIKKKGYKYRIVKKVKGYDVYRGKGRK